MIICKYDHFWFWRSGGKIVTLTDKSHLAYKLCNISKLQRLRDSKKIISSVHVTGTAQVRVHPEGDRGDAAAPDDRPTGSIRGGARVQQPEADARRPGTEP